MINLIRKTARIPDTINDTRPNKNEMASYNGEETLKMFNLRNGILAIVLIFSYFLSNNIVQAESDPRQYYIDSLSNYPENMQMLQILRQQLKQRDMELKEQERELTEEAKAIENILEAKAVMGGIPIFQQRERIEEDEEDAAEPLPTPSAMRAPLPRYEKRPSYMALCHFKICNMGRKRQSLPQIRPKLRSLNSWVSFVGPRISSTSLRHPNF